MQEKDNPRILKGDFSSRTDPPIFTSIAIKLVIQKKLHFFSLEINKPLPAPVYCLVSQIQVQKLTLVIPKIRCLLTFRVESSALSLDCNITNNIRKIINHGMKRVAPRMNRVATNVKFPTFSFLAKNRTFI